MSKGKVVQLPEREEPHVTGEAHCTACAHEWVSVAEVGAVWLECPSCRTMRGLFKYHVEREGLEWACACGNDLFRATPEGFYCIRCGEWQRGF